jgi:hypothetical protein
MEQEERDIIGLTNLESENVNESMNKIEGQA